MANKEILKVKYLMKHGWRVAEDGSIVKVTDRGENEVATNESSVASDNLQDIVK
jgi:hypothetical protein